MGQRGEGSGGTCYWSPESPVKWMGDGAPWRPSSRRAPCEGAAGTVKTLVPEGALCREVGGTMEHRGDPCPGGRARSGLCWGLPGAGGRVHP